MEKRKLGTQGLVVSAIGLGCMGMSQAYGTPDEAESIATLNRAIELGIDFFDTADVYGNHRNEELVGKTLKPFRSKIQIATKFGNIFSPDGKRSVNGRPEYVRSACDGSLSRLGVDHIDLYYQHRVDRNVPIEETVGAMAELVRAGKVRYLGLSEASAATIRRAHKVHPITAVQSEYSLWTRDYEDDVIPTLRELGIGFVPFSPLGRGMLSATIRSVDEFGTGDMRARISPRFERENFERNLRVVDRLKQIADEKDHAEPARARVGARAGRRHGADSGDQAPQIPGGKRCGSKRETLEERSRANPGSRPKGFAAGDRYYDMRPVNI